MGTPIGSCLLGLEFGREDPGPELSITDRPVPVKGPVTSVLHGTVDWLFISQGLSFLLCVVWIVVAVVVVRIK